MPDYVEPADRLAFRCAMAATTFVARVESLMHCPQEPVPWLPDDILESAYLDATDEEFAADTAAFLWSVPRTWSLADDRFHASMAQFFKEHRKRPTRPHC